jgi:hypothetical protein
MQRQSALEIWPQLALGRRAELIPSEPLLSEQSKKDTVF